MGRLVARSARPAVRIQVPRPGTQMPTMAPGTLGLATVWSSACWNWRWMAGGNVAGAAAWARARARPGAGASAARLTVTHSSRAVIRCKRDARRDLRMMDLLYPLSTEWSYDSWRRAALGQACPAA